MLSLSTSTHGPCTLCAVSMLNLAQSSSSALSNRPNTVCVVLLSGDAARACPLSHNQPAAGNGLASGRQHTILVNPSRTAILGSGVRDEFLVSPFCALCLRIRSKALSLDLVFALDFGADERRIENHLSSTGGLLRKPSHEQSSFRVAVCSRECRSAARIDVAIS
jgi:hypothetical protein